MKSKHIYWIIFIWIFIVGGSFYWNCKMISSNNWDVVLNKSRAFFSQIKVTRSWNSMHGGVYVPITKKTKPNEYLKDSLRDIKTIEGLELTKVNPAYMTRQLAEINKEYYEFQSHITSLNPIRPENAADEDMLQTVMRNIVSNAIKFSNEGGNIHVSAYSDGKSTTINIKDEGVGMSEEIKNNIFDANQITTQKGTESEPGSGLGMVLCYELIKMHNGDIIVDSIEGEGTLVSIILPLYP